MADGSTPIVELEGVATHFPITRGIVFPRRIGEVRAVDGVDLRLMPGETLGLVGESGCGKSTLARTILQLVPITQGRVRFRGEDITGVPRGRLRALRREMQMVFQDPYASLNPRMTVSDAIAEPLLVHRMVPRAKVKERVAELMRNVGLAPRFMRKYPHEFSGGQRQRIAVARALALEPALILADEPVSALDVSVQAQILNLLARLRREHDLTLVLIAHDLSVVKHLAGRIAVMYLGRIVELGPAHEVYHNPRHPYTRALVSAVPVPDPPRERQRERMLLHGSPPSPIRPPQGCPFHPRCPFAKDACKEAVPRLEPCDDAPGGAHHAACIRLDEIAREHAKTT